MTYCSMNVSPATYHDNLLIFVSADLSVTTTNCKAFASGGDACTECDAGFALDSVVPTGCSIGKLVAQYLLVF